MTQDLVGHFQFVVLLKIVSENFTGQINSEETRLTLLSPLYLLMA